MKLYTTPRAPNPRRLAIFMAEKGISIPEVHVDIMNQEHKKPDFAARNPLMRVPVLELDDGSYLSESIAICRYFEELYPEPPLFGIDPLDRAVVEMWQRRIELSLLGPIAAVFRHLNQAMAPLEQPQVPEWAEANKPRVAEVLAWLDRELADRPFIAGERYTVADITTQVAIGFLKPARLSLPEGSVNIERWYADVSARPSAAA